MKKKAGNVFGALKHHNWYVKWSVDMTFTHYYTHGGKQMVFQPGSLQNVLVRFDQLSVLIIVINDTRLFFTRHSPFLIRHSTFLTRHSTFLTRHSTFLHERTIPGWLTEGRWFYSDAWSSPGGQISKWGLSPSLMSRASQYNWKIVDAM